MRLINADALVKELQRSADYCKQHEKEADEFVFRFMISLLKDEQVAPTFTPSNEPLTQADLDKMHFDRVWIDYGVSDDGEREGEDGVVLYGKLYSIDSLDGAGFEDLLLDATGHGGDTLDNPSGNYTVYRRPPEGEEDNHGT